MNDLDPLMFGKHWWTMPLAARYASIHAAKAGLAVSVEMAETSGYYKKSPRIIWRGTASQFQSTTTFSDGVFAKQRSGRYVTPGQLRGTVYPDGEERFVFIIAWCFIRGKKEIKRLAALAHQDASYLKFRALILKRDF